MLQIEEADADDRGAAEQWFWRRGFLTGDRRVKPAVAAEQKLACTAYATTATPKVSASAPP
jgi:hypothetical protein